VTNTGTTPVGHQHRRHVREDRLANFDNIVVDEEPG